MIFGVGIDMVQVSRVEEAIQRWGDRFLNRLFTRAEIAYCRAKPRPGPRFALRFAAKEAFAKALGLGFTEGLTFQQIEVVRRPKGQPCLTLCDRAKALCEARGIKNHHLSLSDDGRYAIAMVVLEA